MIDYLKTQKIIHWMMAIIIMLDLNVAQKFGGEMELWDRLESRVDHAQAGLIVTFLFFLRLFLRYRYGAPALPADMAQERRAISPSFDEPCIDLLVVRQ